MKREDGIDSTLGLGELAQLTVNNEADTAYDVCCFISVIKFNIFLQNSIIYKLILIKLFYSKLPSSKESSRKTWNAKYTLRSHFDGVRALAFHPQEPVLITASEDNTLKLWNLHKTVPAKK